MTKPIDLRPDHAKIVHEILARHLPAGVSVRVFGSRAKWTAKTFSDLDLAVKGKEKLPYKVMVELADAFEESDLPFRVDVVDWHTVTPSFQAVIDRDGLALAVQTTNPWETFKLNRLGRIVTGKTPPTSDASNFGGQIPFVTPSDMTGERSIDLTARCLTETGARKVGSSYVEQPAIVVSCIGSDMGKAALVNRPFVSNQQINALIPSRDFDRLFIYYNLSARKAEIKGKASGAAQPIMNKSEFGNMEISIPDLITQQDISGVLSSLDDKIELNRRMNETLEGMAQTIFRDWFVDFGPVRRKEAGEADPVAIMGNLTPDPARAAELAVLFPAAFGDDGLPLGWIETAIGDLVKSQGGSTPSTGDETLWAPAKHYWATPKDLSNMNDLALFDTARQISDAGLAKITSGVLPVGSVLLSSRAPIGYLAIAQVPIAINQGFIGLAPTVEAGSAYLYCWCKANMDKIVSNANGSTFQEISKKNFRPITSPLPAARRLVAEFGKVAEPLFARLIAAARENRTLAETRDYLLPRLMSGAVRVAPAAREGV